MSNKSVLRAWLSWGIATFFVIFQFLLQTSAGIMAHRWKADFHIYSLSVANLSAAFFYAYVFMQIPAGLIYDRYNPRIIMTLAACLLAAGCIVFSFTHDYYLAFCARIFMGFGASFGFIGMLHISAVWFKSSAFPLVVSLSETIGAVATAGGEILMATLVVMFGWRNTTFYAGITAVFIAILAFIIIRNKPSVIVPQKKLIKQSIWQTLFQLSKNKQVWIIGMYGFFVFAIVNVFTALWGVPFLRNAYQFSLHTAAAMLSMVFLGIAIGTLTISWISMKIGQRKPLMLICAVINTFLLMLLLFVPNLSAWIIYLLLFLAGLFTAGYVLCFTLVKEIVPHNYRASALAMINMLMMISAPILQPLVGWFIAHHFFSTPHNLALTDRLSLGILPLGLFISVILVFFMQESYCQEQFKEDHIHE